MPKLLAMTVVLSAALAGCGPSEDEMARTRERDEKFARDFKQGWEKKLDERVAAEQECAQRKQELNPTWSKDLVEKECAEEASKLPWR